MKINYKSYLLALLMLLLTACGGNRNATTTNTLKDTPMIQTAPIESNSQVQVLITGGHDTDPQDNGRPVVLIASMLDVSPEVFREAFSHVTPAGAGQKPNPIQVKLNKSALLEVLGPYGVTNDRLDEVSNYYRYNRSAGETWPQVPAVIEAIVENGVVTGFTMINPGSGYTSLPKITVSGTNVSATATLAFTTDFSTNGSIAAISINP